MTASALLAACFFFSFALRKRGSNAANGEMIGGNPVRLEFHPTRGCASTPLRRRSNAEKGMAQRGHSIFGHRLAADRVFSIRLLVLLCAREGGRRRRRRIPSSIWEAPRDEPRIALSAVTRPEVTRKTSGRGRIRSFRSLFTSRDEKRGRQTSPSLSPPSLSPSIYLSLPLVVSPSIPSTEAVLAVCTRHLTRQIA